MCRYLSDMIAWPFISSWWLLFHAAALTAVPVLRPADLCRLLGVPHHPGVCLTSARQGGPKGPPPAGHAERGGETTTFEVPVAVGALTDLPGAHEMAQQIRVLFAAGTSDDEMARQLTQHGYRSPSRPAVLPSTVKGIRLKLGLMQNRSQSHPRRIAGYLTVPQLAKALAIPPHWVYHQIKRGTVVIQRDAQTRLYLFPDCPETLEAFRQLRAGHLSELRY